MIYQKDWLMRQIESIIGAIVPFLSRSSKEEVQPASLLNAEIDSFLEQGDICGAENWIYENLDDQDIRWLHASVYFYKKLNKELLAFMAVEDEVSTAVRELGYNPNKQQLTIEGVALNRYSVYFGRSYVGISDSQRKTFVD